MDPVQVDVGWGRDFWVFQIAVHYAYQWAMGGGIIGWRDAYNLGSGYDVVNGWSRDRIVLIMGFYGWSAINGGDVRKWGIDSFFPRFSAMGHPWLVWKW